MNEGGMACSSVDVAAKLARERMHTAYFAIGAIERCAERVQARLEAKVWRLERALERQKQRQVKQWYKNAAPVRVDEHAFALRRAAEERDRYFVLRASGFGQSSRRLARAWVAVARKVRLESGK